MLQFRVWGSRAWVQESACESVVFSCSVRFRLLPLVVRHPLLGSLFEVCYSKYNPGSGFGGSSQREKGLQVGSRLQGLG